MKSTTPFFLSGSAGLLPVLLAIVMVWSLPPRAQAAPAQVTVREAAKLTADDAQAGDWLSGWPTFTDNGEFLIVGAFGHDVGPARTGNPSDTTGAVYIFRRDPNDPSIWTQHQKLRPDDLSNEGGTDNLRGDGFGWGIASSGNTIVVTTQPGLGFGSANGEVYIFEWNAASGLWEEVHKLDNPAGSANDAFGRSRAVVGDTLLVGAPLAEQEQGVVYVYDRNEGGADNWGLVNSLTAPERASGARFGSVIQLNGDILMVGVPGDDEVAENAGAVHVFERNEGGPDQWGLVATLTAPDGANGDEFGSNIAVDGGIAIVGTPFSDTQGVDSGAAYVFERNEGGPDQWDFVMKLAPADLTPGDNFSRNISLEGDIVAIAAWGNFQGEQTDKDGSVYVFHRHQDGADQWGQVARVAPSDLGEDQYSIAFGCCGSDLLDGLLVVGEIGDDERAGNAGAVYLFELIQPPNLFDDFGNDDPTTPVLWNGPDGGGAPFAQPIEELDGRLVLRGNFPTIDRDNIASTFASWGPASLTLAVDDRHRMEVRVDLVGASENDAFAVVGIDLEGEISAGYVFFKDDDEIGLGKYGANIATAFFWENVSLKNENVTLSLSLTQVGTDLHMRTRVLDVDNAGQILFDRVTVDTAAADPTVPDRSIKGLRFNLDPEQPPYGGDAGAYLALWWVNPDETPQGGAAEVRFDNFEVRQYASPQLTIQGTPTDNPNGSSETILSRSFDDGIGTPSVDYVSRGESHWRLEASSGQLLVGVDKAEAGAIYEVFDNGSTDILPLTDGKTLEVSVDVIRKDPGEVAVQLGVGDYDVGITDSAVGIVKTSAQNNYTVPILWESSTFKRDEVKLLLRFTPEGQNLLIQCRISDLDPPQHVLYDRFVVDTPGQDAISPLPEEWHSAVELTPAPRIGQNNRLFVGVFNFTTNPMAEVVLDNLEARKMDAAFVRLSWPAGEGTYTIETAPHLDGPWSTTNIPLVSEDNALQATVPAHGQESYFRLVGE